MGTPNSERVKFTKLTDETIKKLEEVFAIDGSVAESCFYANISTQTYYNWIKDNPEMKERFDALRERPVLKARQTVVKSLDDPNHAFRYLERKRKNEFAGRTELTGAEGEKIIISVAKDIADKYDTNTDTNNSS